MGKVRFECFGRPSLGSRLSMHFVDNHGLPSGAGLRTGDLWDLEKMQAYFCHVKGLKPAMTKAANQ